MVGQLVIRRTLLAVAVLAALLVAATGGYTIQPGDTLTGIAAEHGTTVAELVEANGIANPDLIYAGQTLVIPGQDAAAEPDDGGGEAAASSTEEPAEEPSAEEPEEAPKPPTPADRAEVGELIERIATEHGWDPALIKALAWQESGWQQDVVSHANAIGIMQVLPETGQRVSNNLGRQLNLYDPEDNVLAGVLFLTELHELTDGDLRMTLAGYFQGLGNVRRNGLYNATVRYTDNILALRERFR
jgi:soluble lytic murein transglycosylase-like protein